MPRSRHLLYGLSVEASKPLPGIPVTIADGEPDVRLTFAALPAPSEPPIREKPHFQYFADGSCVLRTPHGMRFRLEGGTRIIAEVPGDIEPEFFRPWLCGAVSALLLFQRGETPIHASAIATDKGAVMVAGDSGAGKSTTARALIRRGHRLLSDDLVRIDPTTLRVQPGLPSLKLSAQAASAFGEPIPPVAHEKHAIAMHERFAGEPVAVRAIVTLAYDSSLDRPVIEAIPPAAAVPALHRYVYRLRLGSFMGLGGQMFDWSTRIARQVPMYRLRRPDAIEAIDEIAGLIETALMAPR